MPVGGFTDRSGQIKLELLCIEPLILVMPKSGCHRLHMQPWTWSQPRHDASSRSASTALHPDSLFTLMERHSVRVTCQVMVHSWL